MRGFSCLLQNKVNNQKCVKHNSTCSRTTLLCLFIWASVLLFLAWHTGSLQWPNETPAGCPVHIDLSESDGENHFCVPGHAREPPLVLDFLCLHHLAALIVLLCMMKKGFLHLLKMKSSNKWLFLINWVWEPQRQCNSPTQQSFTIVNGLHLMFHSRSVLWRTLTCNCNPNLPKK